MDENVSRYLARIGSKGGKKRTKTTSPARRREIARMGAAAGLAKAKASRRKG